MEYPRLIKNQVRWFNIAVRAIYYLIIPVILLYFAVYGYYSVLMERQVVTWQGKLNDSLDQISKFYKDEKFFHGAFQAAFQNADNTIVPIESCKKRINIFKKVFPRLLRFIVFDKNGRIVRELSDERRFQYVLKIMYETIQSIDKHISEAIVPSTENLSSINKRIALLRGYFGQFLLEPDMVKPMLDGYLGSCIRPSEDPSKALLWFRNFENFSVIIIGQQGLLKNNFGPKIIVDNFNRNSEHIKLGFFETQTSKIYGGTKHDSRLSMEIESYTHSAVEFKNGKDYLFAFRHVSPELIVFSQLEKKDNIVVPSNQAVDFMLRMVRWVFLATFLIYCASLRYRFSLSIRQKMFFLFSFAAGIPMLVLIATGFEYFEQKKIFLQNQVHEESGRIIKEFDSRYPSNRENIAHSFNQFINRKNLEYGSKTWSNEDVTELVQFASKFKPTEVFFLNRSGKEIVFKDYGLKINKRGTLVDFFYNALAFINNNKPDYVNKNLTIMEKLSDEGNLYDNFIKNLGTMGYTNFGSGSIWFYAGLLGDRSKYNSWGAFIITWKPEELQRAFLTNNLDVINAQIVPRQLITMEAGIEKIFPPEVEKNYSVRKIMHRTFARKLVKDTCLIDNREFIATSINGIEFADATIMVIYPQALIDKNIKEVLLNIVLVVLFSLILLVAIVLFFSNRLLQPLGELSKGIKAISDRDFSFHSNYTSNDEFGDLLTVFNEAISGMGELDLGTSVQKSLLPSGLYEFGKLHIFAYSIFMNKMGGDYYDYFHTKNNKLAICFGDVAGHGIPAALSMAMAKAVVVSSSDIEGGPSELLRRANNVFLSMKSRGWNRMMTALCIYFNGNTGEFRIANAGQCYPIIISNSNPIEYVTAIGSPLGSKTKRIREEVSGKLELGDIMILYSDGIIEALNADNESFGFTRFEELLKRSFNDDIEVFWKGVIKGYRAWAPVQDDDITLMIIKYDDS